MSQQTMDSFRLLRVTYFLPPNKEIFKEILQTKRKPMKNSNTSVKFSYSEHSLPLEKKYTELTCSLKAGRCGECEAVTSRHRETWKGFWLTATKPTFTFQGEKPPSPAQLQKDNLFIAMPAHIYHMKGDGSFRELQKINICHA